VLSYVARRRASLVPLRAGMVVLGFAISLAGEALNEALSPRGRGTR
jgi:hypothetical protein